jgi:hypothetical protein
MLYVESYKNIDKLPSDSIVINTTSRSTNWTKGLSPFIIPAGHLYDNFYAKNIENAWQFAKVYPEFVDENDNIKPEYFVWANKGWTSNFAYRYPMGRDAKPLFSYWDGKRLDYISARKQIYVPLYGKNLMKTKAFAKLLDIYRNATQDIYLVDFDGYNHIQKKMTIKDCIDDPKKKFGHSFVIWYCLEKLR